MEIAVMLLAGSIAASVPAAVDKTLAQLPEDDPASLVLRVGELERQMKQVEVIADRTAACGREAFLLAGSDIAAGAAAWKWCDACEESNPIGFSKEARLGMKIAQLGVVLERCYAAAKDGKDTSKLVKWLNRSVTGAAILNNVISAWQGHPLIRWGAPSDTK